MADGTQTEDAKHAALKQLAVLFVACASVLLMMWSDSAPASLSPMDILLNSYKIANCPSTFQNDCTPAPSGTHPLHDSDSP